ncbi:Mobile element protein [Lutibaculum baratangense AMV1]|uniref:Mutator family transposase n=1 Tax=Lutibaculum baratangense AMV1 TaxID=631454 RepID=V4RQD8_9HYPH|nr:Mobile element protein [Lutibaculum baratangense AMV1]
MTRKEARPVEAAAKDLLLANPDSLREVVRAVVQEMLEAEMIDALGAEKGERTPARVGYRSGYYPRTLITRVGKLELRVPQDRSGRFSTELFERYQRSERALVATLAEMYVQGVSTRKVKAITEELCGHAFSASAISTINNRLDESLRAFARRPLPEPFPYLIPDSRYEKVREAGVVTSQAVLVAIGIDWDGRCEVLPHIGSLDSVQCHDTRPAKGYWRREPQRLRGEPPERPLTSSKNNTYPQLGNADPQLRVFIGVELR